MKTFLQECAEYLTGKYPELHRCCLILPSNRSIRSLREEFARCDIRAGRTSGRLMPDMCSIADWMETVSGCRLPEEEELLLLLYEINRTMHPGEDMRFHQFVGNARMMLSDFNDIDISLADADAVFASLLHIKEIEQEFASDKENELSGMQSHHLQFCRELPVYYRQLLERLEAGGIAYQGLMYRKAYGRLEQFVSQQPFDTYIFIGFSALSNAEEEILVQMYKMGRAEILMDCDISYLNQEEKETSLAGKFIRHLQTRIRPTLLAHDFLHGSYKKIHIYGVPQESGQAGLLPRLLEKGDGTDGTSVIVLLNENMLIPVLYAIPGTQANISMEYRLTETPAYTLLHHFMAAMENMDRLSPSTGGKPRIYHNDLHHFLENPIMQERLRISGGTPFIPDGNALFYSRDELLQLLQKAGWNEYDSNILCALFFNSITDDPIPDRIGRLIDFSKHNDMPAQFLQLLEFLQQRLPPLLRLLETIPDPDTTSARYLLENLLSRISIPFKSNPDNSMQIMGMLETRALDFDNVILLSVNEGVIPNKKPARTLLPYDLRLHYRLPTYQNHEAIMTYHFYRLLQRASRISLCYSQLGDENEVKEKSRLIRQLQNDWDGLENIRIEETIIPLPQTTSCNRNPMELRYSSEMLRQREHLHCSASSLNCYTACPLRYYLQYLQKLKNPKKQEDTIGADIMGTVIHKILEERLRPGSSGQTAAIRQEEIVARFCDSELTGMRFRPDEILHEKNRLVLALCQRYLNNYLERFRKEMETQEYQVIRTEERINEYPLAIGGKEMLFSGIIDREDRLPDGTLRIADYKTGYMDARKLKAESFGELLDGTHKEALQLMLYMLVKHRQEKIPLLCGEIISFQHPNERMKLSVAGNGLFGKNEFWAFEDELSTIWNELTNPDNRFTSRQEKHCDFCDYRDFCIRN